MSMSPPHLAHLAMPFSLAGSSITNVIRDLSKQHALFGGRSSAILTAGRSGDVEHAEVVRADYREYCPRTWFTRREYAMDALAGRLGLERPYGGRVYIPGIRALSDLRPDWVIIHEGHYALASAPRLRRTVPEAKIAVYLHNRLSRTYSRTELRRLLKGVDLVIGVSEFMSRHASERLGNQDARVVTLLNGVDTDMFPLQARPPIEARPLRILYVGQVAPHKGVHVLLEALESLGPNNLEVRIVGSSRHGEKVAITPYEQSLRTMAEATAADITFVPFVPRERLAEHYGWADVVIVPSLFEEPFCLVLLEAMSTGAAVVAADRGGIREAAGGAAVLYDGSVEGLRAALASLSKQVLVDLSRRGLVRASEQSWNGQYLYLRQLLGAT